MELAGTLMAAWLWAAAAVAVAGLVWRIFVWLRAPVPLPMPLPPAPRDLDRSGAPDVPGGSPLRDPVPGEPVDLGFRLALPRGAAPRPRPPRLALRRSGARVGRAPARGREVAERAPSRLPRGPPRAAPPRRARALRLRSLRLPDAPPHPRDRGKRGLARPLRPALPRPRPRVRPRARRLRGAAAPLRPRPLAAPRRSGAPRPAPPVQQAPARSRRLPQPDPAPAASRRGAVRGPESGRAPGGAR